jgi:hypothetical protein
MVKVSKADLKLPIDRRNRAKDRREGDERRQQATAVVAERRLGPRREKVSRRRQIDPTTCERDYTTDEVEFMHALDQYKRSSGRMFPTCSEVLEVLRGIGYEKAPAAAKTICGAETAIATNDAAQPMESSIESN